MADKITHGSGSSTGVGYKIEVRTTSLMPKEIAKGFIIDGTWRTWPIGEGTPSIGGNFPNGIAVGFLDRGALRNAGLLPYVSAEAHRWALVAAIESGGIFGSVHLETRLVAIKYSETWTTEEQGVSDALTCGLPWSIEVSPRHAPSDDLAAAS